MQKISEMFWFCKNVENHNFQGFWSQFAQPIKFINKKTEKK
jgi:hypothetical protein